ncbi:MAG: cyclic nucleotide-binding domain-containing protein, partial [Candidatus Xenobia bacterium]
MSLTTLEKILFLKQVNLFSRLSARDLQHLAQETTEVEFPRNAVIFEEGAVGDSLYVIVSGHAAVMLGDAEKRNMVTLLEERECFGEMAVLSDEPRAA